MDPKVSRLPLPALLSWPFVAFTIELDNEFEHRMRHRTTRPSAGAGTERGPWLTSVAMWSNCLRYVAQDGVTVGEVARLARTGTNLDGMRRWGWVTVDPDPLKGGRRPPRPDAVLRPTSAGLQARAVWPPLFPLVEERWRQRFGERDVDHLREALWAVAGELPAELPDFPPILGHGLWSSGAESRQDRLTAQAALCDEPRSSSPHGSDLSLLTLLSRVLIAYAIDFERDSELSLAISADVLRLLGDDLVRVRDLPARSGVSKESISMAMGILQKKQLAVVDSDPAGSRWKVARLNKKGQRAKEASHDLLGSVEEAWSARFGEAEIGRLRQCLEPMTGDGTTPPPLLEGMQPYADGWRASVPPPGALPWFPMVLHRGGFPDGS